jgi:hypothetical protein
MWARSGQPDREIADRCPSLSDRGKELAMTIANRRSISVLFLISSLVASAVAWKDSNSSARVREGKAATLAQLPLSFEVNRGQAAADAKFVARGGGYALLLTDRGEPMLALQGPSRHQLDDERQLRASRASESRETEERATLRLGFNGSNSGPEVQGEEPLPGHSNYLIGNDPRKWLTRVPHYARVRYREVYPGVDVLYYSRDQQLEYDFIVRPGTNPDSIRLMTQGAAQTEQSAGSLVLKTVAGSAVLQKPVAYQEGPDGEREVACNYVLEKGEIRFALGDYDRSKVLRIDPILSYSTAMDAQLTAIAVDSSGNTYLTGYTASANFPTTPGVFQSTYRGGSNGGGDAIVAKLDPTGSTLLFATYLGGSGNDSAGSIALDSNGNVIVAGWTDSANFPVNHAFQSTLLGIEDAFLSKLDPNGSQLLYSTYLGGSGTDSARGVALDASDRVLVTGSTDSPNFPTSTGTFQAAFGGGNADAFIVKVDTTQSGTASRLFSTYLGGSGEDAGSAIAVDGAGSAFVTGSTRSTNFPTANALQPACASCATPFFEFDAFVSKLNAAGTSLVYSTFLGGNARDAGWGIAVDSVGNAHVAGETSSIDFPVTTGAFQTSERGLSDAFASKLNGAGSALLYSSFVGGDYFDSATGIALDSSGNAYLTGSTLSADFPTVNPLQGYSGGVCEFLLFPDVCSDATVAKIDTRGSTLIFSTYLGGPGGNDSGSGIAVDSVGNAYVAGTAGGTFPFTPGALQMSSTGFAAKVSSLTTGTKLTTTTLTSSPNPSDQGQTVAFAAMVTPVGPTGQVSFRDGNAVIGYSALDATGGATFSSSSLAGGNHSIIASYLGDGDFAASTSAILTHAVDGISLSATQTSATASKGGTATFPLMVTQTGALTSDIAFSCSGLPAGWSCGFNPATVPAGSGPTQVMLTLQAGSGTAQNLPLTPMNGPGLPRHIWFSALVLLMLGIHFTVRRGNTVYLRPAVALGFAALFLLVAGCGSGGSDGTAQPASPQPATVSFAVNARSGSAIASMPFTITVR